MTVRHMMIFIKVYQLLNITKAAEKLYMTQPAVTRAIKEVENYYGIKLFDRINHRIYPTKLGESFYDYAIHICDSFDQMEKGFRDWDKLGVIRIGTTISIGNAVLPKVLKKIKDKYPYLETKTIITNAKTLEENITNSVIDFAVIEGEVTNKQFVVEKIGEDKLLPILPYDSPIKNKKVKFNEIISYPLITREQGSINRDTIENIMYLHEMSKEPIIESESIQAIINCVHEGLGVSFIPEKMVKNHLKNKYISTCSITDEKLIRSNNLVWHKYKFLSNIAKETMELFKNEMSLMN